MSAILTNTPAPSVADFLAAFAKNDFPRDATCWSFNLRRLQGKTAIGKISQRSGGMIMESAGEMRIATEPAGFFGRALGAEMKRLKRLVLIVIYDGNRGQLYLRTPGGWKLIEGTTGRVEAAEVKALAAIGAHRSRAANHPLANASAALRSGPTRKVSRAPLQLHVDMDDGTEPFTVDLASFVESNRGTGADTEVATWARSARVGVPRTFGGGAAGTYTVTVLGAASEARMSTQSRRGRKGQIDQPGYQFYVVLDGKIDSGWEYRSDANDRRKEAGSGYAVFARVTCKTRGFDPHDNQNWLTV